LREINRNLFDLLLGEADAWEDLPEEHQALAIQILARLIAQATRPCPEREKTMNDVSQVKPNHTQRAAIVYIRQSSPAQVENHRESTARQYALVEKACQLGWTRERVPSSTKTWAFRVRDGPSAPASHASPPRSRSAAWASCSGWKSPAWRAIMPTGIASSISAA
jgi:hypothetical protein